MSWRLAHNLQVRSAEVNAVYSTLTIYSIGDQEHQTENSDHNPDSVGVVHAIDIMCAAGTAAARRILPWLLGWHSDLQYVIHNGRIWGVKNGGWSGPGQPYSGSDQHTDHIHVSGKHGSSHKNASTGTGYDLAAEQMTPPPFEGEDVELTDSVKLIQQPDVKYSSPTATVGGILASTNYYVLQTRNQVNAKLGQIIDLLGDSAKVEAAIKAALDALPPGQPVDQATLKGALIDALKELAAGDDDPVDGGDAPDAPTS